MLPERSDRTATLAAVLASVALLSFQLAGKATRDALYLSTFSVASLPRMIVVSALVSAAVTIALSRVMARVGPGRMLPPLFLASSCFLLGEWALAVTMRPVAAVLFYLHCAALGALLISGFWALVTERFDPRTARGTVGQISAGASVGGLLGGLLPTAVGSVLPLTTMFPVLAALHLLSAVLIGWMRPPRPSAAAAPRREPARPSPLAPREIFRASSYLQVMVLLVVLTGAAEGLMDFVFKMRVTEAAQGGERLLRLFAQFYMGTALLSVLIQATLLRRVLARLGPARTAALLPAGVTLGALGGLLVPGLPAMIGARGAELVLRNSVFRGAYELLFTPVTRPQKRAVKLLVDVGASRLGDIAGAALIQGAIVVAAAGSGRLLLAATLLLAFAALFVVRWIHRQYAPALARKLELHAGQLDPVATEPSNLLQSMAGFDLQELRQPDLEPPGAAPRAGAGPAAQAGAPLPRAERLLSRDPETVTQALTEAPLPAELASRAVELLAWDAVAPAAATALVSLGPEQGELLIRHLRDPGAEFSVRRRLVGVLAQLPTPGVMQALTEALSDQRFEVRYRAGRALSRLQGTVPGAEPDREQVLALVLKEVTVERSLWESRRLIDAEEDDWAPLEALVVRERADRSLEHVFTLLTLVLPREPLRLAYQALETEDRQLRGTALEYLESVLPAVVREQLWRFLEPGPEAPPRAGRASGPEVLDNLLKSRESIVLAVKAARRGSGRKSGE